MNMEAIKKKKTKKWYERYLPFVARSTEGQIEWLVSILKKNVLSLEEITPYVKLLLSEKNNVEKDFLTIQLGNLHDDVVCKLLHAADIYDTPQLVKHIPHLEIHHADIALRKSVPPYEKKPLMILDKVFYAINESGQDLLKKAVEKIAEEGNEPGDFQGNYQRFREILKDEKFLLSLYPNARG
ncbi:MAG: hypothetical protein JRJ14_03610 [Deltaproteobacteria bacterium]|nr:hypothetical protein [Deltaproteobacteria bacterium]